MARFVFTKYNYHDQWVQKQTNEYAKNHEDEPNPKPNRSIGRSNEQKNDVCERVKSREGSGDDQLPKKHKLPGTARKYTKERASFA